MSKPVTHLTTGARELNFSRAKSTESWERALRHAQNAEIDAEWGSLGAQTVTLPDSDDTHRTLLVKTPDETYVGACDCDGYLHHETPCAHLCSLRQLEGLGDHHVRTNGGYADELLSTDPADADTEDHRPGDEPDVDCPTCGAEESAFVYHNGDLICGECGGVMDDVNYPDRTATADEKMDTEDTAQPEKNGAAGADESSSGDVVDIPSEAGSPQRRRRDACADPLPDVDSQYVMEMGGETYIRRAGYARLGQQQGFRPVPDIVQYAHEGDDQRAVVLGKVLNDDGEIIAQDVGTAGPPEYEDMDGAEANLDELATTRALTRAMAWATGEGLTAVEEIPGGPDE